MTNTNRSKATTGELAQWLGDENIFRGEGKGIREEAAARLLDLEEKVIIRADFLISNNEKFSAIEKERDQLKAENERKDSDLVDLNAELERFQVRNGRLKAENERLQHELNQWTEVGHDLTRTVERLRGKLTAARGQMTDMALYIEAKEVKRLRVALVERDQWWLDNVIFEAIGNWGGPEHELFNDAITRIADQFKALEYPDDN